MSQMRRPEEDRQQFAGMDEPNESQNMNIHDVDAPLKPVSTVYTRQEVYSGPTGEMTQQQYTECVASVTAPHTNDPHTEQLLRAAQQQADFVTRQLGMDPTGVPAVAAQPFQQFATNDPFQFSYVAGGDDAANNLDGINPNASDNSFFVSSTDPGVDTARGATDGIAGGDNAANNLDGINPNASDNSFFVSSTDPGVDTARCAGATDGNDESRTTARTP